MKQIKIFNDSFLSAFKNDKFKDWFYDFKNGHPFLLDDEVDIIYKYRLNEKLNILNDDQIKELINLSVKNMYKRKFPKAKKWDMKKVFNIV